MAGALRSRFLSVAASAFLLSLVSPAVLSTPVDDMKPGEWRFMEDSVDTGQPLRILVSKAQQRAYVMRGELLLAITTVSTGKPGHETPVGDFPILERQAKHTSSIYGSPMPFMLRLTWDGIALHAGEIKPTPESHGCVRLPYKFAKRLFPLARRGDIVTIINTPLPALNLPETVVASVEQLEGASTSENH